jgi:hypothetical protein
LVNTYGAFGTVGEQREGLIISSATNLDGPWKEYEFKVKPGNVRRPPRFISPYHHRLDWQMWIAATCQNIERSPWMYNFLVKLLQRDHQVGNLMATDPWKDSSECPKYIRVDMYRYSFHKPEKGEKDAPYWDREFLRRCTLVKALLVSKVSSAINPLIVRVATVQAGGSVAATCYHDASTTNKSNVQLMVRLL